MVVLRSAIFSVLLTLGLGAQAFEVPRLSGPVVDEAKLLSWGAKDEISNLLKDLNRRGGVQLQVLTVRSLEGETIEQASIQIVDKWQLGTKAKDNGVLFLIAAQERALRIEVGQGLEGDLPDVYAKRIIEDLVVPIFRSGDFDQGIRVGVLAIIEKTDPQYFAGLKQSGAVVDEFSRREARGAHASATRTFKLFFFFIFFLIFILRSFLPRRFRHRGGYWAGIPGGGWGSGGGSFGGGSGWSGGGGGFSGGGASGRW